MYIATRRARSLQVRGEVGEASNKRRPKEPRPGGGDISERLLFHLTSRDTDRGRLMLHWNLALMSLRGSACRGSLKAREDGDGGVFLHTRHPMTPHEASEAVGGFLYPRRQSGLSLLCPLGEIDVVRIHCKVVGLRVVNSRQPAPASCQKAPSSSRATRPPCLSSWMLSFIVPAIEINQRTPPTQIGTGTSTGDRRFIHIAST